MPTYTIGIIEKSSGVIKNWRNVSRLDYVHIQNRIYRHFQAPPPERRSRSGLPYQQSNDTMDVAADSLPGEQNRTRFRDLHIEYMGLLPYIFIVTEETTQQIILNVDINEDVYNILVCFLDHQSGNDVGQKCKSTHLHFNCF